MAEARATSRPLAAPVHDDRWRIPDALWERVVTPPPAPASHPLGCHIPRGADREATDAILFVLRAGRQWGALDATGVCKRSSAHRRSQERASAGAFVNLWAQGLEEYDEIKGPGWEWPAMDGAMTEAPPGGERAGRGPTDRGKPGAKRSPPREADGVAVGLEVGGANRHDEKVAEAALESIPADRPEPTPGAPRGMCPGKGRDHDDPRGSVREFGFTAHVRARGEEAVELKRDAGRKARRRVVGRTHGRMDRSRRLLIRWEKKAENCLGMLHFVRARIAYRSAGLPG